MASALFPNSYRRGYWSPGSYWRFRDGFARCPLEENRAELEAPAVAPTCGTCGATSAPDGSCLEIGACRRADESATRGASRATAKYSAPRAWNVRGGVD